MPHKTKKATIGVIGQGWVGKHLSQEFETRGFSVVRYALGPRYSRFRERIGECDIVFIAVPTPTTPRGFDDSIVRATVPLVGVGKTAVIKSTVLPGTTDALAREFSDRFVMHVPEFLTEAHAAYDVAHPTRTIVGIPRQTRAYQGKAKAVIAVLPPAPLSVVTAAREAEVIKYAANCFLASKIVFANIVYDAVRAGGCDWRAVYRGVTADPRIGPSHFSPVDKRGARGAGGHCFIKDLAAFARWFAAEKIDADAAAVLKTIERKNRSLLERSRKDTALLRGVYGT